MENGPEFNWEYSHGGQGNPNYSQVSLPTYFGIRV